MAESRRDYLNELGNIITNFSVEYTILNIDVQQNKAIIDLREHLNYFIFNGNGEPTYIGEEYVIYFERFNGKWIVNDIEVKYDAFYNEIKDSDFDKEEYTKKSINSYRMAIANSVDYAYNEPSGTVNPITNTYNRAQAAGYSSVYARAFYNGDFYDSTKDGGDCANYESQCVWAGFGGDLTKCSINDTSYPFDYSGTYFWNQKSNGTGAGRAAWYGSLSLYNYANNSSSSSSENGWKAITGVAWTGATTKNIFPASNNYHGALFFIKGLDVDYGHTIFIMSASGNNPANMWYSAHTRDEYNRQLSTNETYLNNPIRYAIPTEYKVATSCTGTYTAHNYSAPPSGSYSAVCSRCGYVNLYMNFKWARYAPNSNVQIEVSEIRSNKCYEISAVVKREGQEVHSFIVNNSASLVKTSTNMKTKGLYRVYVTVKDKPGGITRYYEYSIRDADANE